MNMCIFIYPHPYLYLSLSIYIYVYMDVHVDVDVDVYDVYMAVNVNIDTDFRSVGLAQAGNAHGTHWHCDESGSDMPSYHNNRTKSQLQLLCLSQRNTNCNRNSLTATKFLSVKRSNAENSRKAMNIE